jgi:hypothetical protein
MNVYETWINRIHAYIRNDEHVIKLVELLSAPFQDTIDACEYILTHIGIDEAEGVILDLFGEVIGVYPRPPKQETRIFKLCQKGEFYDLENNHGFYDDSDTNVSTGGFLISQKGLNSISEPGAKISDDEYRALIRQKAQTFRKFMTRQSLFEYIYVFGARCIIDDDTPHLIEIETARLYEFNNWQKNYIETKGMKPVGIKVRMKENLRHEDSI